MGETFERKVAEGLAEFWPRLVNPRSRLWLAITPSQGGQIVGSIAIDGEDLGAGQAHLRWFILDDGCRGQVGSALLRKALEFVEMGGFTRTVLWTFKGWDAERHDGLISRLPTPLSPRQGRTTPADQPMTGWHAAFR
jgi:hypothetical protein